MTAGPRPCRRCGVLAKPPKTPGPYPTIRGRGLCGPCWGPLYRSGGLADYPPLIRRREDVLEDWRIYRTRYPEYTKAEVAQRIGMTYDALDQVLCRARRAGVEV